VDLVIQVYVFLIYKMNIFGQIEFAKKMTMLYYLESILKRFTHAKKIFLFI